MTARRENVTLWALGGFKAVYTVTGNSETLSFSPDGKVFALMVCLGKDAKIELRETATGNLRGILLNPVDEKSKGTLIRGTSFSPAGDKLVVLGLQSAVVFELKQGKKITEFKVNALAGRQPVWTGDNFLMVGSILYDLDRNLPLCSYDRFVPMAYWQGRVWTVLTEGFGDGATAGLVNAVLPHQKALDFVANLKMEDNFLVYPGSSIRIKLELNKLADEKEALQILTDRLKEKKITVSETAKVTLVLRYKDTGEEEEVGYAQGSAGPMGMPLMPLSQRHRGVLGKVKLKVFSQEVEIIGSDEKVLWNFGKLTTGPTNIPYDKDKKIEEVIKETNKPDNYFAKVLPIPAFVGKNTRGGNALTTARVDLSGVQE